jgi:hypothetical protein
MARMRTGSARLIEPARTLKVESPFDYAANSRVIVVNDLIKDDTRQTAAAMRELFLAAGGGGVGLFTAIRRLKAVYERLGPDLAKAGMPLYAQHVDPLEVGALVDVFRAEQDSCLLGTDAVRDGVDVPGRSLRILAFDRVPWPRPDLLHKARRQRFGGSRAQGGRNFDDALARARMAQAFGRLIRRADDKGVFVMLDAAAPTRLFASLPPGTEVQRMGLAEAVEQVGASSLDPERALLFERDLHALRRPLGFPVEHRLDVVAVGVQQEGGIIARMIRTLSRRAVVLAAGRTPGLVEGLDHGPVLRLKGQMMPARQLAGRRLAVSGGDEQFVGPEITVALAAQRHAQNLEHRLVEAAGGGQILHHQLDVVDQTAAMQRLGFHARTPCLRTLVKRLEHAPCSDARQPCRKAPASPYRGRVMRPSTGRFGLFGRFGLCFRAPVPGFESFAS